MNQIDSSIKTVNFFLVLVILAVKRKTHKLFLSFDFNRDYKNWKKIIFLEKKWKKTIFFERIILENYWLVRNKNRNGWARWCGREPAGWSFQAPIWHCSHSSVSPFLDLYIQSICVDLFPWKYACLLFFKVSWWMMNLWN